MTATFAFLVFAALTADPLGPGDHTRSLSVGKATFEVIVKMGLKKIPMEKLQRECEEEP